MIASQTVTGIRQPPNRTVFVLELVPDCADRPTALGVVALVVKPGAVDVRNGMEGTVNIESKGRIESSGFADSINIRSFQVVLESGQPMLPTRRTRDGHFHASQKTVLPRALIEFRGE